DATNVEDPIHHQIATINLWEDPRRKKQTMHPDDIEEIIMVKILAIGAIVNLTIEMKPKLKPCDKTHNPPANPNTKIVIYLDDSEDEAEEVEKEVEPLPKKLTQTDTPPLKAYKPKILYPQRLNKEKIEARYAKFLDMIKEVTINMEQISAAFLTEECSAILQNKIPPKLGDPYHMGVAENMLVQVGKFVFPVDFIILPIEEDDRVPLILRRPFLHTADAIIRVKNKELNVGIGEDRATFHINKAMQHSHMNDDTCFLMDVINEITEDELDDLLDDSKPFLNTSKKISETPLDKEVDKLMSGNIPEDEVKEDFEELPSKNELRIRTSIQDPPTDLEMKPLPKRLEYAFQEENSLLPVVISALLEQNEKEQLVLVLINHKEVFAWKTSDIPGISPSFCKQKINFEGDVKPVIQRQRQLNLNMKEVIKKRLSNF
ncbi:reverse transcriptase domain-containing protein, partial [Tanacetum coccineum]